MSKEKVDPVAVVVLALVGAFYGIKSVVEYVADVCIQLIQAFTDNVPVLGAIGIICILLIIIKYKISEGKEFMSSLKSLIKKWTN